MASASNSARWRPRFRLTLALVEAFVVFVIIGLIVAYLPPAIQAARESARSNTCRNHLRQISLAALSYESTAGHLPPGTLGTAEAFEFTDIRYNSASRFFWRRFQYTSSPLF